MPGQLETLRGAVFRKVLDLLLREQDLQGGTQTLSLHTTHRSHGSVSDGWEQVA